MEMATKVYSTIFLKNSCQFTDNKIREFVERLIGSALKAHDINKIKRIIKNKGIYFLYYPECNIFILCIILHKPDTKKI